MNNPQNDDNPVFVNIPCPNKEEALGHCRELLNKDLCGTAKIHSNVTLLYKKTDTAEDEEIVLITLKTIYKNLASIHEYMLKNHSWVTPCIEVVPIISDMC